MINVLLKPKKSISWLKWREYLKTRPFLQNFKRSSLRKFLFPIFLPKRFQAANQAWYWFNAELSKSARAEYSDEYKCFRCITWNEDSSKSSWLRSCRAPYVKYLYITVYYKHYKLYVLNNIIHMYLFIKQTGNTKNWIRQIEQTVCGVRIISSFSISYTIIYFQQRHAACNFWMLAFNRTRFIEVVWIWPVANVRLNIT